MDMMTLYELRREQWLDDMDALETLDRMPSGSWSRAGCSSPITSSQDSCAELLQRIRPQESRLAQGTDQAGVDSGGNR